MKTFADHFFCHGQHCIMTTLNVNVILCQFLSKFDEKGEGIRETFEAIFENGIEDFGIKMRLILFGHRIWFCCFFSKPHQTTCDRAIPVFWGDGELRCFYRQIRSWVKSVEFYIFAAKIQK